MLSNTARAALSQGRRRLLPSSSLSSVHLTCCDVHQHQRRSFAIDSTTPLCAQPNKYVTGATSEQVEASQAMKDWYAANFEDWQDEPDQTIIPDENEEEEAKQTAEEEDENPSIIKLPEHLVNRNIRPLVAYLRRPGAEEGTRNCNRLRNPGINEPYFPLTPGIIHGSDPTQNVVSVDASSKIMVKTPWFEIQRELARYHHGINGSFENRVYALTVFPGEEAVLDHHRGRQPKDKATFHMDQENNTYEMIPEEPLPPPPPRTPVEGMENILVIPSDLQMHPVYHTTFCLNFKRYHPSKPINIPIKCINEEESPAIKRGGFLGLVNRFVECVVEDGAPIPEFIPLECTGLRQKDVVRRDKLVVPEGVTIHPRVPKDYLMGTVYGVRGGAEGEDEEGEGEESA